MQTVTRLSVTGHSWTDPLFESSFGHSGPFHASLQRVHLALLRSGELRTLSLEMAGLTTPNPDWAKFVQGLREAGMTAYKAAQSKNQDTVTDAAGTLSEACSNCHDKYREKPTLADRCK